MSKSINVILVLSGLLSWSPLLFGQANWQTRLQEYLTLENQRLGFHGVCLVAKGEEVIYHQAFGKASFEHGIPMNTEHRFKIASISKSFTGLLMGLAVEEGRLKAGDRVGQYLPEFVEGYWKEVSLQQLLTHTSGVPHHAAIPDYWKVKSKIPQATAAILGDIKALPFLFRPGTDVKYSSPAYYLLAQVLEKVYQKDYHTLLAEKIIEPLRLKATGVYDPHQVMPGMTTGYHLLSEDSLIVAPYRDFSPLKGAGSLYSNSTDLLTFNQSLLQMEPWSEALLTRILTPQSDYYMKKRPDTKYGYGWYIRAATGNYPKALFHGGGTFGCSALSASSFSCEGGSANSEACLAFARIYLALDRQTGRNRHFHGLRSHFRLPISHFRDFLSYKTRLRNTETVYMRNRWAVRLFNYILLGYMSLWKKK